MYALYILLFWTPLFDETDNTQYVTNNFTVGTLNRCTRNLESCKLGGKKRVTREQRRRRWGKNFGANDRIYTPVHVGVRLCAEWGGGVPDREFVHIYGRKTKGYVLLHTYSIWKMATQGITRRFFFLSLPRAKRSVFISTRFLLFGAHDLFNTRFPNVGCIMEQKCSIFFLYEWHATTVYCRTAMLRTVCVHKQRTARAVGFDF
jgi:hypothetical protein